MPAAAFIVEHGKAELPQVVLAAHPPGRFPRRLHGRQQHADEHADDRDHDEQLHEREASSPCRRLHDDSL
jgi:hypothetical protein